MMEQNLIRRTGGRYYNNTAAVYHAVCDVLKNNTRLTTYNFSLGALAAQAQISRDTMMSKIARAREKTGGSGTSPYLLLDYFDLEIKNEFASRTTILYGISGSNKLENHFYCLTTTIVYNAEYIDASMSHFRGSYPLLNSLLASACLPLWNEYYYNRRYKTTPDKQAFFALYKQYCLPLLTTIIVAWWSRYGLNPAYSGFYAMKLAETCRIFAWGEKKFDELLAVMTEKPTVQNPFFIDNDEWEHLNQVRYK